MTNKEEIKRLADNFIQQALEISARTGKVGIGFAETVAKEILKHYLPSSALVRPLVWEWLGDDCMALTPIGLYNILDDGNYYLTTPFDIEGTFYASLDEAKQAAQNHFNTLIGSCLVGGGYTEGQVREAIAELWKEEFGDLKDDSVERDGYFVLGFVARALQIKSKNA